MIYRLHIWRTLSYNKRKYCSFSLCINDTKEKNRRGRVGYEYYNY